MRTKCLEVVKSLEDGLHRLFGSYFHRRGIIDLPTGRRFSGFLEVESYLDDWTYTGVTDYRVNMTSPPIVTLNTCVFRRTARWKQHGCSFAQDGMVFAEFEFNQEIPAMGFEVRRWVEYWDVSKLSADYDRCLKKEGGKRHVPTRPKPVRKVVEFVSKNIDDPSELPRPVEGVAGGQGQWERVDPSDVDTVPRVPSYEEEGDYKGDDEL